MKDDVRFPFVAADRAVLGAAVESMRPIVVHLVRKIGGRRFARQIDDITQDLLIRVWKALPRYDATKASLTTFIYRVVSNGLITELRRKQRPNSVEYPTELLTGPTLNDRQIELIAARVMASPEAYLTDRQTDCLRAMLANPGGTTAALGATLGVHRQQAAKLRDRMLRRIAEIADADDLPN